MKTIGIIISGLGFDEGSSVWDVSYILREVERYSIKPIPLVPNESIERSIPGPRRKNAPMRDFAAEAAQMVRGDVMHFGEIDSTRLDGLIFAGGKGNVNVLCSLLRDESEAHVLPELKDLITSVFDRGMSIGACGYGAALVAFVLRGQCQPIVTVGDDAQMIELIKSIGADVIKVQPHEVIFDDETHIFSTPGTHPKSSLLKASFGIETMIQNMFT